MLIKVFENWINSDHIVSIKQYSQAVSPTLMTLINFQHGYLDIKDKTPNEVAQEINNQIKANKE